MYFADTNLLEFNQYQKYNKALFIIYADLEYIHNKSTQTCIQNLHLES